MSGFKNLSKLSFRLAVSLALISFSLQAAHADSPAPVQPTAAKAPAPKKTTSAAPSGSPQPSKPKALPRHDGPEVVVNPDSIRSIFLDHSITVLQGLNAVYQARNSVSLARGNLLPQLNLGLSTGVTGSGFALNSVAALLPFLLPTSWANVGIAEKTALAAGEGYYSTELNGYMLSYQTYLTILANEASIQATSRQLTYANEILKATRIQANFGNMQDIDVAAAKAQVATVEAAIQRLHESNWQSIEQFRISLSMGDNRLRFQTLHPAALAAESWTEQQIFNDTFRRSPEFLQSQYLIEAARDSKVGAIFSPLSGYQLTPPTNADGTVSLGNWHGSTQQINATLGFGLPSTINGAQLNVEAYQLQQNVLYTQVRSNIRSTLASIRLAAGQVAQTKLIEDTNLGVYHRKLEQYSMGQGNGYIDLQTAATNVFVAAQSTIQAQLDLDNQRVALYRIMIEGPFRPIPACQLQIDSTPGIFKPLQDLVAVLAPQIGKKLVDASCRVGGTQSYAR